VTISQVRSLHVELLVRATKPVWLVSVGMRDTRMCARAALSSCKWKVQHPRPSCCCQFIAAAPTVHSATCLYYTCHQAAAGDNPHLFGHPVEAIVSRIYQHLVLCTAQHFG
jgi:hypothetical protein